MPPNPPSGDHPLRGPRLRSAIRLRARGLWDAAAALTAAASLAGYLGRFAWWLDLASHFRAQYAGALIVFAASYAVLKARRAAVAVLALALLNLAELAPLYAPPRAAPAASLRRYKALLANVNTQEGRPQAVIRFVRRLQPDLALFEEVNQRWMRCLQTLRTELPHVAAEPREDNFGIALFSRYPLRRVKVLYLRSAGVPSLHAQVSLPEGALTVLGTHPPPPVGARNTAQRNEQLEAVATLLRRADRPVLLLGDLNTSPWSWIFARLLRQSGLRDASRGRGVQPTWPTTLWPLLIPIDHCLHSDDLLIREKRIGPAIGSDHYPVIVVFSLARAARAIR